ncbi:MAG TPA: class I SAM-dependent methyltransferase [Sporosarcina sp.]|nr:class I SAM-dependent methyltransferase [Sporosarcina sp.]
MNEKERERLLQIHTTHLGEQPYASGHYHHYEPTPYATLDVLFEQYDIRNRKRLVDYGCGKGRILFYVHHYFHLPVVGVEFDDQLYREALLNETTYLQKKHKWTASITIEHQLAEQYDIQREDDVFFLFNPFSLQIFMTVIQKIMKSVEAYPRTVDIILYYPTDEFHYYLTYDTPFTRIQEVKVIGDSLDHQDRFLIYRYAHHS